MKIMIVVGARPNFMKAGPLINAIRMQNQRNLSLVCTSSTASAANGNAVTDADAERIELVLVHTGQHYDAAMSGSFFADLELPAPDVHLEVGSGSHAVQTAEIMRRFEQIVQDHRPDAVIVVGDVNSTVACALVAAKISYDSVGTRPLIAHVEAGLRSFDRAMPEEINRIVTDHLSDLLFVTEESGVRNLKNEGVPGEKIHFVGNTMIDSLLVSQRKADKSNIFSTLGIQRNADGTTQKYALLTLHRPSNVDSRETFLSILDGLTELAESMPIFFSTHPRTRKRIAEFGLEPFFQLDAAKTAGEGTLRNGIYVLDPVGYIDFLALTRGAAIVVTDSGGIQEETTCLKVPCVTVRDNTERPVTVTCGTNVIAGTHSGNIREAIQNQLHTRGKGKTPEKWDGKAGERIIEILTTEIEKKVPAPVTA
jgi:UDP-N-acetylglucosamine 2-epimerase (non-hydrolysing)